MSDEAEHITRETAALIKAADRLDHMGRSNGWWKGTPWRELDPIGRDEFLATVYDIVATYNTAYAQTERPQDDPFVQTIVNRHIDEIIWAPKGAFPPERTEEAHRMNQQRIMARGMEFVGQTLDECRETIKETFPGYEIHEVPKGHAVTFDMQENRIRVFYDGDTGLVTSVRNG